ncbi:hypothetical protein GQR60_14440 [Labilibaculum sp. A4]|nr:hypothetical protein [Labilibaculum euxinus]MDQ1770249.1 hypothetical protein [Labilibaculum euxinus]MWN77536.1 hypothetical protein [Labilibaculum euxinus]
MIEYYLHLNALTDAPDDCIAKPSPIGVLTREDLIKECLCRRHWNYPIRS